MRPRKKKHREERLAVCGPLFASQSLPPRQAFADPGAPLRLEIGCGKGGFIYEMALRHPQINFLAVEKMPDVLVTAMERAMEAQPPNLRFVLGDVENLGEWLRGCGCEIIYLNFSDPWPGKKRAKRRLTHGRFLELYKGALMENGEIQFKSDNRPLFEFTVEELGHNGFELSEVCFDLAKEPPEGNVATEYEQNFIAQGIPICRCVAKRKPAGQS